MSVASSPGGVLALSSPPPPPPLPPMPVQHPPKLTRASFSEQSRFTYRSRAARSTNRFENIYEEGAGDAEEEKEQQQDGPSAPPMTRAKSEGNVARPTSGSSSSKSPGASSAGRRRIYYAVRQGHKPGVYRTWEEAEAQFKGYPDPRWQTFRSPISAQEYVSGKSCFNDRKWQADAVPDPFFQDAAAVEASGSPSSSSSTMPLQERLSRDFNPTPRASGPSVLLPPLAVESSSRSATTSPHSVQASSEVKRSSPLRQSVVSAADENAEATGERPAAARRSSLFARFSLKATPPPPPPPADTKPSSSDTRSISGRHRPRTSLRASASVEALPKGLWGDVYINDPADAVSPEAFEPEVLSAPKFSRSSMKRSNVVMPVSAAASAAMTPASPSPDRSRPVSQAASPMLSPKPSRQSLRPDRNSVTAHSLHDRLSELANAALDDDDTAALQSPPRFGSRSRSSSTASSAGPATPPLLPIVSRDSMTSFGDAHSGYMTAASSDVGTHAHSESCTDVKHAKSATKRKSGLGGRLLRALKLTSSRSTSEDERYMQTLATRRGSS